MQRITAMSSFFNPDRFITEQVEALRRDVGDGIAINALSGGVDSSTVTALAHRALGSQLKSVFVATTRSGSPSRIRALSTKTDLRETGDPGRAD